MKTEIKNVQKDYVSCNFCSRGELKWGFSKMNYPYESVIEFGRSIGSGVVVCICEDCISELCSKVKELLNKDQVRNGASQGTMPNEPNPDNQKSYSELEKEWKQKLCDGVDNLHELFKAKLKEKEDEITQLKAALSKAQSKITELLIERDERK